MALQPEWAPALFCKHGGQRTAFSTCSWADLKCGEVPPNCSRSPCEHWLDAGKVCAPRPYLGVLTVRPASQCL